MLTVRRAAAIAFVSIGLISAQAVSGQAQTTSYLTRYMSPASCVGTSGKVAKVSSKGNLYNDSTTASLTLVCPVDPDLYFFDDPAGFVVNVTDNSASGVISCRASTTQALGITQNDGAAQSTAGVSGSTYFQLAVPPSHDQGTWTVRCTLPKRASTESSSMINSIWVYQPQATQ